MRMSVITELGVVLLIAAIVATGCGGGASYASPVKTVNTALDAMEDLNIEKVLDCVVPECEERAEMAMAWKLILTGGLKTVSK